MYVNCNRRQLRLLVRPAKPLTSRLPEPSRTRREHSRGTQHWLEQLSKFEACNKHCIRPSDSKNWTVLWRRFSACVCVCGVQQSDENWRRSKGDSVEERQSVEWVKRICEVLCSRPACWINAELSAQSILKIRVCSVFITSEFVLSVASINAVIC